MDKINHCINHNRFIPIDTEELSALELIGKGTEKTNELVDKSNDHEERITNNEKKKVSFDDMENKYKMTYENGTDYRGKWFGLDEPTLSDEGMRSQVQKNRDDIIKTNEQLDNIALQFKKLNNESNNECLNRLFNLLPNGGTILFDKGTYLFNNFTLPKRIKLRGQGQEVTILKLNDNINNNFITIDGGEYCGLYDLTIHGNKSNNTKGCGLVITNTTELNSRNLKIENINIVGCKEHGVKVVQSNPVWIFQLRFIKIDSCDGYGLWNNGTDNSFYMIDIYNCKLGACYDIGNNNRFVGGKWYCNGDITGATNTYAFNCQGSRSIYSDIELQDNYGNGMKIENCSNSIFNGFIIDSCGVLSTPPTTKYGLMINNAKNITFNGNITNYINTQNQEKGLFINGGCENIKFIGAIDDTKINTPIEVISSAKNIFINSNIDYKTEICLTTNVQLNFNSTSWGDIIFNTEVYKNRVNYLDGLFTVNDKGTYLLDFNLVLRTPSVSTPNVVKIYLYKNGSVYKKLLNTTKFYDTEIISLSSSIKLSTNDSIKLQLYSDGNVYIPSNEPNCKLTLSKIE